MDIKKKGIHIYLRLSEVFSRSLCHRQLWMSNLSKVAATQWLEVDSNLRHSAYKAQNIPLHHRVQSIYAPCLRKKTVQNCFCQNFVKFPSILITFDRWMK